MTAQTELVPYRGATKRKEMGLVPYQGRNRSSSSELVPYRGSDKGDGGWFGQQLDRMGVTAATTAVGYSLKKTVARTIGIGLVPFVEPVDWPETSREAKERMGRQLPFQPLELVKEVERQSGKALALRTRTEGEPSAREKEIANLGKQKEMIERMTESVIKRILVDAYIKLSDSDKEEFEQMIELIKNNINKMNNA